VAEQLPFTYTGADFYALCSDAMLKAVTRQASAVDAKIQALNAAENRATALVTTANFFDHHATAEDIAVMVTEQDFLDANRELVPSVSAGELKHYEKVRETFEGGREKKKTGAVEGDDLPTPTGTSLAMRHRSSNGRAKGKGKGKAVVGDSRDDDDDDNDNDGGGGDYAGVNGRSTVSRGKGKAVAARFQDGTASDDEGLY
jgi:peroxin-6